MIHFYSIYDTIFNFMIGFGHNYLTTKEVEGRVSSTGKLISSFAFHVIHKTRYDFSKLNKDKINST